ncbi:hypothetical protein ACU5DF_04855 [Aliivibrio wodanis]|uniref:hypothetical protein n=1 Tax=Aliivibrio wodanis TaxID=80852 RepID=UPI00406D2FAA
MIHFIDRYEKLIIIMFSMIQTIVIVASIFFAINEFKGKETDNYHNVRAESWDIYKSNKNTISALREFWHSVPLDYDKKSYHRAITLFYSPIESDVLEMYTEFEMCLRVDRCNEEILLELACSDAINVARIIYQDHGDVLFYAYSVNKSSELPINMFHFTKRCVEKASFVGDFEWLENYQKLVLKH